MDIKSSNKFRKECGHSKYLVLAHYFTPVKRDSQSSLIIWLKWIPEVGEVDFIYMFLLLQGLNQTSPKSTEQFINFQVINSEFQTNVFLHGQEMAKIYVCSINKACKI